MVDSYSKIREFQKRCTICNSNNNLQAHHRVFRSEWNRWLENIFSEFWITEKWWMDDIQNLVILCANCHLNKVHWWDYKLREQLKNSYTNPNNWFNISFKENNNVIF